jgi:hypothetical protein
MRYLVITKSGMYGPANEAELTIWAEEGRLAPSTVLEEEGTGRRSQASDVVAAAFTTFRSSPQSSRVVSGGNPSQPSSSQMQPIPPQMVSNYYRPGQEPPLFLGDVMDGKRELRYSFLLAVAGPIIALVSFYGIAMALGGVYVASLAIKRGRKLAFVSLILNIIAIPAALIVHFGIHWLF